MASSYLLSGSASSLRPGGRAQLKEQRAGLTAQLGIKLEKTLQKPRPQIEPLHISRADVTGTNTLARLYPSPTSTFKASGVCSPIAVWGFMYVAPISLNGS